MRIEYKNIGRNQVQFISDFFFITIIFGDIIEYKYIDTYKIIKVKSNDDVKLSPEISLVLEVLKEYRNDERIAEAYSRLSECVK